MNNEQLLISASLGLCSALLGIRMYNHIQEINNIPVPKLPDAKNKVRAEDYISLSDLAKLVNCQVTSIRNSLIHQFSQTDSVSAILISKNIMSVLTEMVKLNFSNPTVQKLCFHAIVRILSTIEDENESVQILEGLADLKLISLASGCLRNSDVELASWSIFVLHEYVIRKVKLKEICGIKGFIKIITPLIKNSDTILPRIILRLLKCLCESEKLFYKEIVRAKMLDKIAKTLQGHEEQTMYWALGLLHILAFQMPSQKSIFESGALSAMLAVHDSAMVHIHLYVIEILGVLCTDPLNIPFLERSKMTERLISYIKFTDYDIKHTAVTVLVNIASVSSTITNQICDLNGVQLLTDIVLMDETDNIRQMASKAILSLANNCETIRFEVVITLIRPLFYKMFNNIATVVNAINGLESKNTAHSPTMEVKESVYSAGRPNSRISNDSYSFSPTRTVPHDLEELPISPQDDAFQTNCSKLLTILECLGILLKSKIFENEQPEDHQPLSEYIKDILDDVGTSLLNALVFPLVLNQLNQQISGNLETMKLEIPKAAVECIVNLLYIESFREFMLSETIISILFVLLADYGHKINKPIIYALPHFASYVAKLNNEQDWVFFKKFVSKLCDFTLADYSPTVLSLDETRSTQFADIENHSLHCFNKTWTFETVVARYGVSGRGKWAYEFQLGSAGIIQLGWVCAQYEPKEYGGWGVGDDMLSYAFDGSRIRKWHGRDVDCDEYGIEWSFKDVVTCLIDLDSAKISYMLNGNGLGIAFEDINVNETWYPAASLTGEQWGEFQFGGDLDHLKFCPAEYHPIPVPDQDTFHSAEYLSSSADISNIFYSAPLLAHEKDSISPVPNTANIDENFARILERIDGKDKLEASDKNEISESGSNSLHESDSPVNSAATEDIEQVVSSTPEHGPNISDQSPKSPKKGKLQITTSANLDICMYYELKIGKLNYEECVHIGYITSHHQIITLVFQPQSQVIYLVKISTAPADPFCVDQLEKILESGQESDLVHVFYKVRATLGQRTIGVGIDSSIDSVYFTLDGKRFGPFIPRNSALCTPYIRDLSRGKQ
ncbi:hypothetical protein HDV01_006734 [Terramyces sp. JEL0728]|nr:hypothetical protein HDV01_006734 [Terramyces sp. JEL0728]